MAVAFQGLEQQEELFGKHGDTPFKIGFAVWHAAA
jgi:hypothetical protein